MKTFKQFLFDVNEAIEYVTGDETSKKYAADHGGSNYHDHVAFKDEKTRLKAQAAMTKAGWEIGSTTGGKHADGSYHYSGQAFDVPMYKPSGGGVQKGFEDSKKGEREMSAKFRADLAAAGYGSDELGVQSPAPAAKPTTTSAPKPTSATKSFTRQVIQDKGGKGGTVSTNTAYKTKLGGVQATSTRGDTGNQVIRANLGSVKAGTKDQKVAGTLGGVKGTINIKGGNKSFTATTPAPAPKPASAPAAKPAPAPAAKPAPAPKPAPAAKAAPSKTR